ncbi:MAG: N-acetylglucosamine kinase [Saprospiraceae bacterium]|nr:N-acetylglucosamine kinase [Bacteroidia bacterium]NNE13795.1 N-acetylglucosamine kinase [Saprospiraceae bacterium]NNL90931.1 N-acetylglucosamine kinase [Saprospiraceae bacterium]
MILIADGGSTSCDWVCLNTESHDVVEKITTNGINPTYSDTDKIKSELENSKLLSKYKNQISGIYFFGAGCKSEVFAKKLEDVLRSFFPNLSKCNIKGDIEGAVYACTNQPSVVGILGTGSNICFYDGTTIHSKLESLGYSIMDDGGGSALGRMLIRSYFYNELPTELGLKLSQDYNLDPDYLKSNIYQKPFPGRFLASYAKFVFENLNDPFIESLLNKNLENYFQTHVLQYKDELQNVPIHFVGTVAFKSHKYLQAICDKHKITLGHVIRTPIDTLAQNVNYYI